MRKTGKCPIIFLTSENVVGECVYTIDENNNISMKNYISIDGENLKKIHNMMKIKPIHIKNSKLV